MATNGAIELQKDFFSLIRYLNPTVSPELPGQKFHLENISDDNIQVLSIFLNKTKREILNIQFGALSENAAKIFAQSLEDSPFRQITLSIKNIPVDATLSILRAIANNKHVQKININIPQYVVDDIGVLRAFVKKPLSEQAPRAGVADVEQSQDMAVALAKDLEELKVSTLQTFNGVVEQGRSFFNAWVTPTARSVTSLLFEDDPAPAAAGALEQRVEEGRRSPTNTTL